MIIVTGGAGFIGSHLTEALLSEGEDVLVIDNLSTGKLSNLSSVSDKVFFKKMDLRNSSDVLSLFSKHSPHSVFHFAADADVKSSSFSPNSFFENNVLATFNVLEACRKTGVKKIVFASTSAVYGDSTHFPTQETASLLPISNYGASKAACESFVCSYSHSYEITSVVLRFANVFGERSTHGVIFDFFRKIKKNPSELEILGNGLQSKSFLYVSDAVSACILSWRKCFNQFNAFNVGSSSIHSVKEIADEVCSAMNLSPSYKFTGGERGWVGDTKKVFLDSSKLINLGWREKTSFKQGLKNYIAWLEKQEEIE